MRLKKRKDLVMLWRMSRFESVREVAQNPDILRLIFAELDPMWLTGRLTISLICQLPTKTAQTRRCSVILGYLRCRWLGELNHQTPKPLDLVMPLRPPLILE